MDTQTLLFGFALIATALALIMVAVALSRREPSVTGYAFGFVLGMVGAFLPAGPATAVAGLAPWLRDLLSLGPTVCLVWGARRRCGFARPWAPRFWAYLGLFLGLKLLGLLVWDAWFLRAPLSSLLVALLAVEFMLALGRGAWKPPLFVRAAAWTVGAGTLLGQAAWVIAVASGRMTAGAPPSSGPEAGYAIAFQTLALVLWAGLALLIEIVWLREDGERRALSLEARISTDTLTGLANRQLFETRLNDEIERAARYRQPLSLVLFDLDYFKRVNDTWGHAKGDEVLRRTARIVGALVREPDGLFRWGGEEFAILVPHTGLAGALSLAEKVREALATDAIPLVGTVTASFGVAEWRPRESQEQLFKEADFALYRAKRGGRNRVVGFGADDSLPLIFVRLEWKDEWNSGCAQIDEEHKRLFELSNELIDLSLARGAEDRVAVRLDALLKLVYEHFDNEERLLGELGYPDAAAHGALHRELVAEALQLQAGTDRPGGDVGGVFNFLVGRMVIGHILKSDILFFPYTRASPSASTSS